MAEAPTAQDSTPDTAPRKKRVYTQLWFWVLVGITLGHRGGPGRARARPGAQDPGRPVHPADQGGDRAGHLLHGRRRHRLAGQPGPRGRAGAEGPGLLPRRHRHRAVPRPARRQPRAARRRVPGAAVAGADRPGQQVRRDRLARSRASRPSCRTSCSRRASCSPSWTTRSCRCWCWRSSPPARSASCRRGCARRPSRRSTASPRSSSASSRSSCGRRRSRRSAAWRTRSRRSGPRRWPTSAC